MIAPSPAITFHNKPLQRHFLEFQLPQSLFTISSYISSSISTLGVKLIFIFRLK